jgi:hypothetical protein
VKSKLRQLLIKAGAARNCDERKAASNARDFTVERPQRWRKLVLETFDFLSSPTRDHSKCGLRRTIAIAFVCDVTLAVVSLENIKQTGRLE